MRSSLCRRLNRGTLHLSTEPRCDKLLEAAAGLHHHKLSRRHPSLARVVCTRARRRDRPQRLWGRRGGSWGTCGIYRHLQMGHVDTPSAQLERSCCAVLADAIAYAVLTPTACIRSYTTRGDRRRHADIRDGQQALTARMEP